MTTTASDTLLTFPRFRFAIDGGNILRGAAAFAHEWDTNGQDYVRSPSIVPEIRNRVEGIIFSAFVDSFLVYISDLLTFVFAKNPKMILKGSIDQHELWRFDDIKDLRWHVIEKTVIELSYKSFRDLNDFLGKNYSFRLAETPLREARLGYIFEMRNSIVHNRGLFSAESDRRLKANGRLRDLPATRVAGLKTIAYVIECANEIDRRAASKFSLVRCSHQEHLIALNKQRDKIAAYFNAGKRPNG